MEFRPRHTEICRNKVNKKYMYALRSGICACFQGGVTHRPNKEGMHTSSVNASAPFEGDKAAKCVKLPSTYRQPSGNLENNIDESLQDIRSYIADGQFAVDVEQGEDHRQSWAVASTQGRRPAQEDCHAVQLDLEGTGDGTSLYALFDGHSGKEVAIFAAKHLPSLLVQTEGFARGSMRDALTQSFLALDTLLEDPAYQAELFAMRQGLHVPAPPPPAELASETLGGIEEPSVAGPMTPVSITRPSRPATHDIHPSGLEHIIPNTSTTDDVTHPGTRQAQVAQQLPPQVVQRSVGYGTFDAAGRYIGPRAGSAAVVALVRAGNLFVGSVGDSRCVLGRAGHSLELTHDHKPDDPAEAARIYTAGLDVQIKRGGGVPRVNGSLAMSRALGDVKFKDNLGLPPEQQAVSALPDTRKVPILGGSSQDSTFMILACDGVWDVMESSDVVQFVYSGLDKGEPVRTIARNLVAYCLESDKPSPSTDNITAILVLFKRPAL